MVKVNKKSPIYLIVTAIFTALVCVVTIMFSAYVPATEGFFNIGESMVFLSALLFGPYVGSSRHVKAFLSEYLKIEILHSVPIFIGNFSH